MSAPAGPCEWCGGPQWWTVVRGEVWVSCKGGCSSLPGLEDLPRPDSDSVEGSTKELGYCAGEPGGVDCREAVDRSDILDGSDRCDRRSRFPSVLVPTEKEVVYGESAIAGWP